MTVNVTTSVPTTTVEQAVVLPASRLTWLRNSTLGQVQDFHAQGAVTQDEFEAFMHAWATGAPRFGGFEAWEPHEFTTPNTKAIAEAIGCCKVGPPQ